MAFLIGCIVLGFILGWKQILPQSILANSGKVLTLSLVFLLLTMGLKIGIDKETLSNLGKYGLQAILFGIMTIVFSLAAVALLEKLFTQNNNVIAGDAIEVKADIGPNPYRMTFIIIGAFIVGILLGLLIVPLWVNDFLPTLTNWALYFTVFAVGIDLGMNKEIWKQFVHIGRIVFLAPIGVAIGSIIGGMITGKLLGWTLWEGGAVGAGFGWYSLSGVLISEMHSVGLGTIAFLSNVFRELIAIIIIPLLAGRIGKLTLVAPGGATTMDTTLPIIAAVGPPGAAIIAFINGVVLSTLVPILVPLLLSR